MNLGCGSACAPLGWDALAPHAIWGAVVWAAFLSHGIALVIFTWLNHVDRFIQGIARWRLKLHGSFSYNLLCFVLSIAQSVLYCMRAHQNTLSDWEVIIEIVAACLYSLDLLISWFHAFLSGLGPGLFFMFSFGALDCLLVPSAFCLFLLTNSEGAKSWGSFSFLAALHVYIAWSRLLVIQRVNLKVWRWQLADTSLCSFFMIYCSAMTIMTLENLGDPEVLRPYNDEKWTIISSLYFVFVSISTVGYGDLAPVSVLGRLFVVFFIFGGLSWLLIAVGNVVQAISMQAQGGGYYEPMVRTKHVVITGNPTLQMAKDFIAELFHPDHSDDAEDLFAIFLFQKSHPATPEIIQAMSVHLKQRHMARIAQQVRVFQGSVLDPADLDRVAASLATGVFVLPNNTASDPLAEDTENIIRMMAVQQIAHASAQLVLLLSKSENQRLLAEAGISGSGLTCLALDQMKMEIMGKSCMVPGFTALICNLCKSIETAEDTSRDARAIWQQEYDRGLGQELYEVDLSPVYAAKEATFGEVVIDVLEQTGGTVYTIGLVERRVDGSKTVLINPGTAYPIKQAGSSVHTLGIFIAPDRDAVIQCEGGMVFLGRRVRPRSILDEAELRQTAVATRDAKEEARLHDLKLNEQLLGWLDKVQAERAKTLVSLVRRHHIATEPQRPPLKLLARGGHVLLCCVGASANEDVALGFQHFISPLRNIPKGGSLAPIVILCTVVPTDWYTIVDFPEVYFVRGSPGNLFDLERCCFRGTSTIAIFNVSATRLSAQSPEPWMVDSEVVCCARLVESQLSSSSTTQVITELSAGSNHTFLPTVQELSEVLANGSDEKVEATSGARRFSISSFGSLASAFSIPPDTDGRGLFRRLFSLRSDASVFLGSSSAEYYRQQRFACGQMFVGSIITSLVVNTFYNPSLYDMIHSMIGTHASAIKVPKEWVGKSYFEFFDHLLYSEGLMAVGIFRSVARRVTTGRGGKLLTEEIGRESVLDHDETWMQSINASRLTSYIYTSPPGKETTLLPNDRVIAFSSAIHRSERGRS